MLKRLLVIIVMGVSFGGVLAQDGAGDPFYPQMGNAGYDVRHYTIDLEIDHDANTIDGTTTIEAVATDDLPLFHLDFIGLTLESVTVNNSAAAFTREGQELIVTPAQPVSAGSEFTVAVAYNGQPQPLDDPGVPFIQLGWQVWRDGYIAAVSQPSGSKTWFPANNHPTDKATYTFQLTTAPPNIAAANGVLTETIENADGTRTFVWEMDDPMASYLAIAAVGDFTLHTDESPGGVPIRNYIPTGADPAVIAGYANTGAMMDYLIDVFGPYPFDVYGVVAVPGFPAALETQTLSIFGGGVPNESTVMHELLHQWIGNSVTVAEWEDIWLHEGMATYFEALWTEETQGADAYTQHIQGYYNFASGMTLPAPGTPAIEQLFGASVYVRGALVLHALRMEIGDKAFFETLRTFYERYEYRNATTEDFIAVAEEVSGQALNSVFDAWLFSDTLPPLP